MYVANQTDDTVSVIDGNHCQGTDTSGCNQSWPTIPVGAAPQALAFNPTNNTLYVTNTDDNTVSVVSGNTVIATIPVAQVRARLNLYWIRTPSLWLTTAI